MTKRDVILVLEDTEDRVKWLTKIVEPMGYWVNWCVSVSEFLQEAEGCREQLALLVLDHDLGYGPPDGYVAPDSGPEMHMLIRFDAEGLCGLDAAKRLGNHSCPALVWSWNPEGRKAIVRELASEDKVERILSAAFVASEDYAIQIRRLLG